MTFAEWLTVILAALAVPQIGGPVFGALAFVLALLLSAAGKAGAKARHGFNRAKETASGYVGRSAVIGTVLGAGATGLLFWLRH